MLIQKKKKKKTLGCFKIPMSSSRETVSRYPHPRDRIVEGEETETGMELGEAITNQDETGSSQ